LLAAPHRREAPSNRGPLLYGASGLGALSAVVGLFPHRPSLEQNAPLRIAPLSGRRSKDRLPYERSSRGALTSRGAMQKRPFLRRSGLPPSNHPRPAGASPEPSSRRAYRVGPPPYVAPTIKVCSGVLGDPAKPDRPVSRLDLLRHEETEGCDTGSPPPPKVVLTSPDRDLGYSCLNRTSPA
jgi:hypothetical protein